MCWVKPFPQNWAFIDVFGEADEEGLKDGTASVDDVAALLVCQVVLLDWRAHLLLLKLLELIEHGLLDVQLRES